MNEFSEDKLIEKILLMPIRERLIKNLGGRIRERWYL